MPTLTVTHTESITLDGRSRGAEKSYTIASIESVHESSRVLTTSTEQIITMVDAPDSTALALDVQLIKYIRLTNLDDVDTISLGIIQKAGTGDPVVNGCFSLKLLPGESFVAGPPEDSINALATNDPTHTGFVDLQTIEAKALTNTAKLEIFVAMV